MSDYPAFGTLLPPPENDECRRLQSIIDNPNASESAVAQAIRDLQIEHYLMMGYVRDDLEPDIRYVNDHLAVGYVYYGYRVKEGRRPQYSSPHEAHLRSSRSS